MISGGRKERPKLDFKKLDVQTVSQPLRTPENLDRKTQITHGEKTIIVEPEDVETICELGRGAYGIVERVKHRPSEIEMAVKVCNCNLIIFNY